MLFTAIDFETADTGRDSACSVAVVRMQDGVEVDRASWLIRPPRRHFEFTHIHGITWAQVAQAPSFAELWPQLATHLGDAQFVAAHNAAFDRSVLYACCAQAGVDLPAQPFLCTVKLARRCWDLHPTKLPDVCRHLGIPLRHHDAESDASACAHIVNAAFSQGHELDAWLGAYHGSAGATGGGTQRPRGGGAGFGRRGYGSGAAGGNRYRRRSW